MATEIDTATDHADLFERLMEFLQLGETTPGGPDWTLLRYDDVNQRALFQAPGPGGTDEIHIGVSLHEDDASDTYALGFWMFRAYQEDLEDLAQPGTSEVVYLPVWNQAMPYWFIANGHRLMIVAKVSTVYAAGYVGRFLPYGTPGEYPQPYYLAMPVSSPTTRWSTVNESDRNFFDPGHAYMLQPSGIWRRVRNFQDASGAESNAQQSNYIWPYQSFELSASAATEYRRLRENVDGTYPLWPLILVGSDPEDDIYGELDGAYAVSGFGNASENIVEIGSDDYLVVQNLFRTGRQYYAALKME